MVKASHRKGSAFDKPGPDYKYLDGMRVAGAASTAASMLNKDAVEKAILEKVANHPKLSVETKKRFNSDTRSALRRVKDSAATTPCSDWSRKGCT